MKYGLSKDKVQEVISNFPVALDNICRLEKCEFVAEKGVDKSPAIEFTYAMEANGTKFRIFDTCWSVNESKVTAGANETMADAIDRVVTELNTRMRHIATKFNCSDEELEALTGRNFQEYAQNYCNLINNKRAVENPLLFLKTVNSNGYVNVAKYPAFLQRVDTGDCKLSYTRFELERNSKTHSNGVKKEEENYV